jgi:hypothetical protein
VTTLDNVARFKNGRQVSAYIGLVPRQYQSGETDRNGRITKRGSRILRTLLLECAWVSVRHNDWSRATYERIHGGQKTRKKKAAGTDRRLVGTGSKDRGGSVGDAEKQDGLGSGEGRNHHPANNRRRAIRKHGAGRCDRVNDLTRA